MKLYCPGAGHTYDALTAALAERTIDGRTGVFMTAAPPGPVREGIVVVEVPNPDSYARGPEHPGDYIVPAEVVRECHPEAYTISRG